MNSVKNNANLEKEEEMFSDSETENGIQALEDQIRNVRRQGKKGKTSNGPVRSHKIKMPTSAEFP